MEALKILAEAPSWMGVIGALVCFGAFVGCRHIKRSFDTQLTQLRTDITERLKDGKDRFEVLEMEIEELRKDMAEQRDRCEKKFIGRELAIEKFVHLQESIELMRQVLQTVAERVDYIAQRNGFGKG